MRTLTTLITRTFLAAICSFAAVSSLCHAAAVSESKLIDTLTADEEHAEQAAEWLGGLESVQGLKAIIAQGNPELVRAYLYGFPKKYTITQGPFPYVDDRLNPELEDLVRHHLDDGEIGRSLLSLLSKRKYRSRALFEEFRQRISEDRPGKRDAIGLIMRTDLPDIESPLLDLLPKLDAMEQDRLFNAWRERPFPPKAFPVLKNAIEKAPELRRNWQLHLGIAKIGTPNVVEYLVSGIEQYRDQPLESARGHVQILLNALANVPETVPIPMDRVVASVPHKQDERIGHAYIRLLKVRMAEQGIDDLLVLVLEREFISDALWALYVMESPQAWRRIREGLTPLIEQDRLPGYRDRAQKLLAGLSDPDSYRVKYARHIRKLEYDRRRRELDNEFSDKLDALEERDPDKYRIVEARYQELGMALHEEFAAITVIGGAARPSKKPHAEAPPAKD